jgi:hypothetical protein
VRRSGFIANAEGAHVVQDELLKRGLPHSAAAWAGHAVAVGGRYNFQGNARLSGFMHRSTRTAQRARRLLEELGLIKSFLLLTGDMVPGQRSPVAHPQVVRDVSALQALAISIGAARSDMARRRKKASARPSVADVPKPATADELQELAARAAPEFAAFFHGMAAARRAPPNAPQHVDPREVDEVEREIADLERSRPPASERGPPRAPPAN